MNVKQKLHQAHLTEWAALFSDQKASGLTVRQWCQKNHISIHKYNYWKHLLKEQVVDQMLPDIVQVSVPSLSPAGFPAPHSVSADSELTVRANRTNRTYYTNANVRLCVDGVAFELEPTVSEDFLRTLIRAVHYA
jgi:hypothetical protein